MKIIINENQYKLILENYLEILKNNSLLDSTGIEGRFLNKRQAKELENEIVSNYSDELKFGKEDNDIRRNIFNIDNPLAEKTINGVTLKIVEGLIKNKRKTYLLYADDQLIGEFYSVKDIKNIVDFLESKLIKNLKWNCVMKIIINEGQLRQIIESEDKMKLLTTPADLLLKNTDTILNNYKKKGFNGINVFGDLDLSEWDVEDIEKILNEVVIVTGNLDLRITNITTLGKLKYVGGDLYLSGSEIKSLGDLEEVGGYLYLRNTPISRTMSKYDIKKKIKVGGVAMIAS